MKLRPTRWAPKTAVVVAAIGLAASLVWSRNDAESGGATKIVQGNGAAVVGGEAQVREFEIPESERVVWSPPAEQSGGAGWMFELFTPPTVYRDEPSGAWVVGWPGKVEEKLVAGPESEARGEAEVRRETREMRPLRVAGYFGKEPDWVVAFVSAASRETAVVRTGHRFEQWGWLFESFGLARDEETGEPVGRAVLRTERSGEEIVLESSWVKAVNTAVAANERSTGAAGP